MLLGCSASGCIGLFIISSCELFMLRLFRNSRILPERRALLESELAV